MYFSFFCRVGNGGLGSVAEYPSEWRLTRLLMQYLLEIPTTTAVRTPLALRLVPSRSTRWLDQLSPTVGIAYTYYL